VLERITVTESGIYTDMRAADYFADPAPRPSMTQSIAKLILERSPLHAWHAHPRLNTKAHEAEEYSTAQAIGNAAHKLLLGRGKDVVIIEADNFRTKQAQETRDQVSAEGKVPILAKHHLRARVMVDVARARLKLLLLDDFDGDSEAVLVWNEDGSWYRSMIDRISADRRIVLDYKTSGMNCAPHVVGRMMVDAGWDLQAAMHERGLNAIHPDSAGRRRHIFIAQENEEPYALTVCELSEAVLTMGRKKLHAAINLWGMCKATNNWPGYPSQIVMPEYPGFAENQWLEREEREFSGQQPADLIMGG
jgi:hypothetical protein